MLKNLFIAIGTLALTGVILYHLKQNASESESVNLFRQFKLDFNKSYGTKTELEYRFLVFQNNLKRIDEVNNDSSKRYKLGINQFADLSWDEFKNMYLMKSKLEVDTTVPSVQTVELGTTQVDWRNSAGAVGAIKDQGQCGSCWAFSANAALEFVYWNQNQSSINLSEQELVDCSTAYGNYGCNGGLMTSAVDYVKDNGLGVTSDYPYRAVDQACKPHSESQQRVSSSGYSLLNSYTVEDLAVAAVNQVISIAIEVQYDFQLYTSGVFHASASCGDYKNHGVAVVGYDFDASDPYFIVRNSWGTVWGDNGYIKIAKSTGRGTCGIASDWDVVPNL